MTIGEIVVYNNIVPFLTEGLHDMTSDVARAACNENLHGLMHFQTEFALFHISCGNRTFRCASEKVPSLRYPFREQKPAATNKK